MRDEPLPPGLAREGLMMRDALARDLAELPDVTVVTTHDDRLPPPPHVASVAVPHGRDPWKLWNYCATKSNAAWPVAPETGGVLERLTALCASAGALIVGSDAEAIRVAGSKRTTAARLIESGVPALPVWTPADMPEDADGLFVTKPDDGAGCEQTRLWRRRPTAAETPKGHVVQPYEPGEAASITILRTDEGTTGLAANRQHVRIDGETFVFDGLTVGALDDPDGRLAAIAEGIGRALPGLRGIFGVDLVIGEHGPVVLEINPRLTTSYVGLRASLAANPAAMVEPFASARPALSCGTTRPTEISL